MRNKVQTLSFVSACTGLFLFFGIDLISLVVFESPLIAGSLIAYISVLTLIDRRIIKILAVFLVAIIALVKGASIFWISLWMFVFWLFVLFLKRFIHFSLPVRFFLGIFFLVLCEPIYSWSLIKVILNLILILAGLIFFVGP